MNMKKLIMVISAAASTAAMAGYTAMTAFADDAQAATAAAADGTLVYTMIIKNYIDASVTIKKVDQKGANLPGSKFRLCKYGTSWEVVDGYSEIDLTKVNSKKLTGLSVGRYRLEETQSPDGYVILIKYTYFNIAQNGTASLTEE